MADPLRIGLTGDVMLGRIVNECQQERPPGAVWGDLLDRLRSLDGLVINLECCLSTRGDPWTETYRAFHFRADPGWAIPALEEAGVDAVALANNHVLDFGRVALRDTLGALDDAGIARAGAGETADEAWSPTIVRIGDLDVALVSFTDNTPESAAGPESPGTAHAAIDVGDDRTRSRVEAALSAARSADPDLVVASLHWGPNMVERPPPAFRRFARWLLDAGVDVLHGHSAHVFQGVEVRDGRPILYDTGDFVDDYAVDPDLRNDRGFLFELAVDPADGAIQSLRLVPTEIGDCRVNHASAEAARWSRERMRDLSGEFDTRFDRDGDDLVCDLAAAGR